MGWKWLENRWCRQICKSLQELKGVQCDNPSLPLILGLPSLNSVFSCEASVSTWYYYVGQSLEEFLPSIGSFFSPAHQPTHVSRKLRFHIPPCSGVKVNVESEVWCTRRLPPEKVPLLWTTNTKYTWLPRDLRAEIPPCPNRSFS